MTHPKGSDSGGGAMSRLLRKICSFCTCGDCETIEAAAVYIGDLEAVASAAMHGFLSGDRFDIEVMLSLESAGFIVKRPHPEYPDDLVSWSETDKGSALPSPPEERG